MLNADDPVLLPRAAAQVCKVALFAFDDMHPALVAHREAGGTTCGLVDEELYLSHQGHRNLLGNLRDMPLTLKGAAMFNVANIAAAALAATVLGVSPKIIAALLRRFGNSRVDNPGRLDRWALADITVLIDYAHNPDGLRMLLEGIGSIRSEQAPGSGVEGRVGLLLGQAGNRSDEAIAELARVAALSSPDFIVIKEIASMLRGRTLGEVPALLRAGLLATNFPPEKNHFESDEVDAARYLLSWAKAGDVVVLPIHQSAARKTLAAMLDEMEKAKWQAGLALPSMG